MHNLFVEPECESLFLTVGVTLYFLLLGQMTFSLAHLSWFQK